jgi:spore photoproduct lyase
MIRKVDRKSFLIRESGRSTDFITPSFGHGCLYECSYCYMKRHKPKGLDVANNYHHILTEVNNHVTWLPEKEPNQCDPIYWTYDISCNEDFALHAKYHNWEEIFKFFRDHDRAKASFATKYVQKDFLKYDPDKKVRIRFSLIPEKIRKILEPNTSTIKERIEAINDFYAAGYEVHVNFSPVVVYEGWLDDYRELLKLLDEKVNDVSKEQLRSEVIFLTHNENKHKQNLAEKTPGENLLWNPKIQETKTSQYGGKNIRYRWDLKQLYIKQFKDLSKEIIPYCDIRYIF